MSALGNTPRGPRFTVWIPGRHGLMRFARVVGTRVREAREAADLSIFELARLARVDAAQLRRCEIGIQPPSLFMLAKIAGVLRCDVRELMP